MGILISNLSSTTNIANSDRLILDQSDKTVKITLAELSTHFALTDQQAGIELSDIETIDHYTVIGNVSGSAARPSQVSISNNNALGFSTSALATQGSIKTYVESRFNVLNTKISAITGDDSNNASLYSVWEDVVVDTTENAGKLLTQASILDYIKTRGDDSTIELIPAGQVNVGKFRVMDDSITPSKLSEGAPVWAQNGNLSTGSIFTNGEGIEINVNGGDDRNAYIDFHTSDDYPADQVLRGAEDYHARLIRDEGVNGEFKLENTGTGAIVVTSTIAQINTNSNSITTKEYVDAKVLEGGGGVAVGGSSVLRYGEINAGDISTVSVTNDQTPTTSGDFTTTRSIGTNEGENFFTCTFNTPLPNANYNVIIEMVSNNVDTVDVDNEVFTIITAKATTGFQFNAESGRFVRTGSLYGGTDVSFNVRIESSSAAAVTTSQAWEDVTYVFDATYTNNTGSPLLINGFGTSAIGTNLSTNVIINAGLANEISIPFVHNWADAGAIGGNQASVTIPNGATYKFVYDPNSNVAADVFFWQQMVTTAVTGSVINGDVGATGPTGLTGPQGPAAATYVLSGTQLTITTPEL